MSALVSNLHLAATSTAARCARVFVTHALREWQVEELVDDARLIVSELVTNSVRATGVLHSSPTWAELDGLQVLRVGLHARAGTLNLQVWDSSVEPPVWQKSAEETWAEGGRGLDIVENLARRVGHFFPRTGGKVVWAELSLDGAVRTLPLRTRKALSHVVVPTSDPELLRRLLDGLRAI